MKTLAIAVGEPEETVEDVYEPFLIQQGLLMRTHRGRVATPAAWAHLGVEPPPAIEREAPPGLFRGVPVGSGARRVFGTLSSLSRRFLEAERGKRRS